MNTIKAGLIAIQLDRSKADADMEGSLVAWVGDGGHRGTDIYYSERLVKWVFVDLENLQVNFADRVAVYSSEVDGDETGLNQADIVAVDFDGPRGSWVIGLDATDDPSPQRDDVELVWTD